MFISQYIVELVRILHVAMLFLPLPVAQSQTDDHYLNQMLFCQPGEPASGLLQMFDEDQMFSYNFTDASTIPWLRDFDQWKGQAFPKPVNVSSHLDFCKRFLQNLTEALREIMPEARGGTRVTVFTAHPLHTGEPNTLICAIDDVYPPALTITWRRNGKVLSQELNSNAYFAMPDQSFQAFSYLNVTPSYDDIYSCNVQVWGDNRTIVGYWVPDDPVPSELLENGICGLSFTLGVLLLLLGVMFCYLARKGRNTE